MLRVLITSTMKSEPGREMKASPRMLAAPSAFGAFASAACATLVAAVIAAAVAAPAAAAPFRNLRRSSPGSSSCVLLRAFVIGVSSSRLPLRGLRAHLSKNAGGSSRGRPVPPYGNPRPAASVGARQAEHVLGEVAQHEVGRDRCDLVEPRLAELALGVVLLGEAEAAVGL